MAGTGHSRGLAKRTRRGWATWTLPKKYFQGSYLLFLKLKPILEGSPKTPDTKQVLWGTKAPPQSVTFRLGAAETQRQGRGPGEGGRRQYLEESVWKKKACFNWSQIQRGSLTEEQATDPGRFWFDHLAAPAETWPSSSLCPAGPTRGWVPRRDGTQAKLALKACLPSLLLIC